MYVCMYILKSIPYTYMYNYRGSLRAEPCHVLVVWCYVLRREVLRYIYIYIYTHTHIDIYMYVYIYTYIYKFTAC